MTCSLLMASFAITSRRASVCVGGWVERLATSSPRKKVQHKAAGAFILDFQCALRRRHPSAAYRASNNSALPECPALRCAPRAREVRPSLSRPRGRSTKTANRSGPLPTGLVPRPQETAACDASQSGRALEALKTPPSPFIRHVPRKRAWSL
ncbi:hypothetical protein F4780DRAFT_152245 [Xylariomycetidae sp. FL0641]|nr:hypothetical protein F4780DRAFT_152245 [Xylariomycetidae sp. FL0641]